MFCAGLARDQKLMAEFEGSQAPGLASHVVFEAMGTTLLDAEDELRTMLSDQRYAHGTYTAVRQLGPAGIVFAPDLLTLIESGRDEYNCRGILAAVASDDPTTIDKLIQWLDDDRLNVHAAVVISQMGLNLAGRHEDILPRLWSRVDTDEPCSLNIRALGSVGRHDSQVVARLVALAKARPERMVTTSCEFAVTYDAVMGERAAAIDALKWATRFADQALPVLIDAFDTFEEYDPDMTYHGEHERVCDALKEFGPLAAPAIPRLDQYLQRWLSQEAEFPTDGLQVVAKMGKAAKPLLGTLRQCRDMMLEDGNDESELPTTFQSAWRVVNDAE